MNIVVLKHSNDKDITDRLVEHLKQLGNVWQSEDIIAGKKEQEETMIAISEANIILICSSIDYINSFLDDDIKMLISCQIPHKKIYNIFIKFYSLGLMPPQLAKYKMLPSDKKPISKNNKEEYDEVFIKIIERLKLDFEEKGFINNFKQKRLQVVQLEKEKEKREKFLYSNPEIGKLLDSEFRLLKSLLREKISDIVYNQSLKMPKIEEESNRHFRIFSKKSSIKLLFLSPCSNNSKYTRLKLEIWDKPSSRIDFHTRSKPQQIFFESYTITADNNENLLWQSEKGNSFSTNELVEIIMRFLLNAFIAEI